jgi:hypothetical protein
MRERKRRLEVIRRSKEERQRRRRKGEAKETKRRELTEFEAEEEASWRQRRK